MGKLLHAQGKLGDILYVDDSEVKAAAEELHAYAKRLRAAVFDALQNAQSSVHPHTRSVTTSILKTLIHRTK